MPTAEQIGLSDDELHAIRGRLHVLRSPTESGYGIQQQIATKARVIVEDAPKLLDEVDRLRFRCRMLETFIGPTEVAAMMGEPLAKPGTLR